MMIAGKNFRGTSSLTTEQEVTYWLGQLAKELDERLGKEMEDHKRVPTGLTLSFSEDTYGRVSRNIQMRKGSDAIATEAFDRFMHCMKEVKGTKGRVEFNVTCMYLGAHGFEPLNASDISQFFSKADGKKVSPFSSLSSASPSSLYIEKKTKGGEIRAFLSKSTAAASTKPDTTSPPLAQQFEGVDPEFLDALPKDIRAELEAQLRGSRAQPKRKSRGIEQFLVSVDKRKKGQVGRP